MKIAITDAFSPANLGDAELVARTIDYARARGANDIVVLAVDPGSFAETESSVDVRYVALPLSRLRWRSLPMTRRVPWLGAEVLGLVLGLVLCAAPLSRGARRRVLVGYARLAGLKWLSEVAGSDEIIAVAGGYLGDRYLRGSLVALTLYRIASGLGLRVETMPLSISSATSHRLRFALRRLGRGVQWRARDRTTLSILADRGLPRELVPDLAWLNAPEGLASHSAAPAADSGAKTLVVAPVGAAFYSSTDSDGLPASSGTMLELLSRETGVGRVLLVPMHVRSPRMQHDGGDEDACDAIQGVLAAKYPEVSVSVHRPQTYDALCALMRTADFAICERLHAALAALTQGTRTWVVGYEPKHRGVLEVADLTHVLVANPRSRVYRPNTGVDPTLAPAAAGQRALVEELFNEARRSRSI